MKKRWKNFLLQAWSNANGEFVVFVLGGIFLSAGAWVRCGVSGALLTAGSLLVGDVVLWKFLAVWRGGQKKDGDV